MRLDLHLIKEKGMRIPVTLEIEDEVLKALRQFVAASRPGDRQEDRSGTDRLAEDQGVELPTAWRQIEERHGVVYTWGEDHDVYDPFKIYEGEISSGTPRLAIGRCERARTFGDDRIYYIVASLGPAGGIRAVAEFLATDDYDETGDVIAVIKGKGGSARQFDSPKELPVVYRDWPTLAYRERVDYPGAYSKQALICNERNHEAMLNHALAQIQLRGLNA
jgi:hypothetical protein